MGMHYNVTFHNAIIRPERYGALIGWTPEDVAAEPEKAAELALDAVRDLVSTDAEEPQATEEGIDISECGFYDGASYGYGERLTTLLASCVPGAYIHEVDAEEGTGQQWRHLLLADGTIRTISPELVWPEVEVVSA